MFIICNVDLIVVVYVGCVVEIGFYEELLMFEGGVYFFFVNI